MRLMICLMIVSTLGLLGCGGGDPPRTDFPQQDIETQNAIGMKSDIDGLMSALKSEGVNALRTDLLGLVESFEESGEEPTGPHAETYKSIQSGLKELQSQVDSGASPADLQAKIEELQALAAKLPGDDAASGGATGGGS